MTSLASLSYTSPAPPTSPDTYSSRPPRSLPAIQVHIGDNVQPGSPPTTAKPHVRFEQPTPQMLMPGSGSPPMLPSYESATSTSLKQDSRLDPYPPDDEPSIDHASTFEQENRLGPANVGREIACCCGLGWGFWDTLLGDGGAQRPLSLKKEGV